jgi:hypothetical protein
MDEDKKLSSGMTMQKEIDLLNKENKNVFLYLV